MVLSVVAAPPLRSSMLSANRLRVLHGLGFHPKLRLTPGFELHSSVAADVLVAVDSLA